MSKVFVKAEGGRATGNGSSTSSAVTYERALELLENDLTMVFLPGTYFITQTLDLTPYTGVCVYGDGKVNWVDENSLLLDGIILGSQSSASNIRFKNFQSAARIADGHSDSLIKNCFEYHYMLDPSKRFLGQGFKSGLVSNCTLENLTSLRAGPGIGALSDTTVRNCLSNARPAFFGEIVEKFDSLDYWTQTNQSLTDTIQLFEDGFYEGGNTLYLAATNFGNESSQYAALSRTTPVALARDMDRGGADQLYLVINLIEDEGIIEEAEGIRYTIGDNSGNSNTYYIDTNGISLGLNVFVIDLSSPDDTVGSLDRSTIVTDILEVHVEDEASVILGVDYTSIIHSDNDFDFNAAEAVDLGDVMGDFRGASGVESDALAPPFEAPNNELFRYVDSQPNFQLYSTGGENGVPIGALWPGSHVFSPAVPGHISMLGHRVLTTWSNDENFFDTAGAVPGPDGEGFAGTIDQSAVVVSAQNAATTVTPTVADADLRAGGVLDDDTSHLVTINNTDTVGGPRYTFGGPVVGNAGGAIGWEIEYKVPAGELPNIDTDGVDIVLTSAGGTITGRVVKADLVEGFNPIRVLFATPDFSTGVFDPAAITQVDVVVHKPLGTTITNHVVDHIFRVLMPGYSSAPVAFDGSGNISIDLVNFPEGKVARALLGPFLVRNVGDFLRAQWGAVETPAEDSVVNAVAERQDLATRSIEFRYSELKFGRYEPVVGSLAQEWRSLNRVSNLSIEGTDLWLSLRVTLRNRIYSTDP